MNGRHRTLLTLAALAFASLGVACGPDYERLEIEGIVQPSGLTGEVSRARIVVPHGMVMKAHIVAFNDDDDRMALRLRPVDTSILSVETVIADANFAFLGLRPGTTDVEVLADGERVLTIQAVVPEQPSPR